MVNNVLLKIYCCVDIRLTNGTDVTEGIIEINDYQDHTWKVLCNNNFNDLAANLICRQLRFGLPVLYRRNSTVNSGYYAYQYYYSTLLCIESAERYSHCYYYRSFGRCFDTFLKCSSMYRFIYI